MDFKICPDCKAPFIGPPHSPKICISILRDNLEEAERELRIAESNVEWLRKHPEEAATL